MTYTYSLVGGDTNNNKVSFSTNSSLLTVNSGSGSVTVRVESPDYPTTPQEATINFAPARAGITFTNLVQTQGATFQRVYNLPSNQASLYAPGRLVITYNENVESPTQPGSYTVLVSVLGSDPDYFGSASETLTIQPSFAASFGGANPNSDTDGDGVPALLEYAFNGSTNAPDWSKLPQINLTSNTLSLTATVRTNDPTLIIEPERATNLSLGTNAWTNQGITRHDSTNTNGVPPGFQQRTYSTTVTNEVRAFLRLQVRTNSPPSP